MTPWSAAHQASLSLTVSQSLPKFMSTELVMLSKHLYSTYFINLVALLLWVDAWIFEGLKGVYLFYLGVLGRYIHTCCSVFISGFSCLHKNNLDSESLWLQISRSHFLAQSCILLPVVSQMSNIECQQQWSLVFTLTLYLLFGSLVLGNPMTILLDVEASVFGQHFWFSLNPPQELNTVGWIFVVFPFHCHPLTFKSLSLQPRSWGFECSSL